MRFNTSYVSVQEMHRKMYFYLLDCFNTSYVSVQEKSALHLVRLLMLFQYILCVGSRIFADVDNKTSL